ncbi:MAG: phospholipase C [Acidimicrobiales bacterium]
MSGVGEGEGTGAGARRLGRRAFLSRLAAGGAVLAGAQAWRSAAAAASVAPAGSDLGAVEHVVFLMQENRSFDHYFGTFPGVRGFDDHPAHRLGAFAQRWPANTTREPVGRLLPFHLDTATTDAECTFDLSHAWTAQHACWHHGAMDAFVTTHTSPEYEGPDNGVLTMGYYTRSDLPFYYALAEAFTICDGYHCSVLGPTDPNRLLWLSGTIDPEGHAGGPVITTSEDNSVLWSARWPTMAEVLDDHGVSWKVYNPPGSAYLPSASTAKLISNNCFLYFAAFEDPGSTRYEKAFLSTFPGDFARDVAAGTLPAVSWVIAPVLPRDMSEHPPAPPALGEYFTHRVLTTLASNPKVWSKTVLFLSYDENDGFFDHVPPPTPPPGTPGEYLSVDPLPAAAGGVAGPVGLGMRVPMLVVSPFSRGGHVVAETADHTSQLRFLEARFGVPVPNLSRWRRRATGDLTAAIRPSSRSSRSLPSLPATPSLPSAVARECRGPQLVEVDVPSPPYPVPVHQSMPVQEHPGGGRRHRGG